MESMLFTLAVLFMLILVFNAVFNLFCGLCAAFILWRDLSRKTNLVQTNINTGRYQVVEDIAGNRKTVSSEQLIEDAKLRDLEFEEWLMRAK